MPFNFLTISCPPYYFHKLYYHYTYDTGYLACSRITLEFFSRSPTKLYSRWFNNPL